MAMRANSSSPDAAVRERTALTLLDQWPWESGGVLIGGYAVSAYGHPRYSEDVDVVIPARSVSGIQTWLRTEGFTMAHRAWRNPQNYDGQVFRFVKETVTLDVLSGAVRDREAQVDVPERWISDRPKRLILEMLSARSTRKIPIARPEALWALKLQSGRDQDLSDLFALMDQPTDVREVRELFERLAADSLSRKFQNVLSKLGERRLFEDSLSRLRLGSPKRHDNIQRWKRFTSRVQSIIGPLAGTTPVGSR